MGLLRSRAVRAFNNPKSRGGGGDGGGGGGGALFARHAGNRDTCARAIFVPH